MSQDRWDAVDRYFADLLLPPDPVLDATLQASAAAGLPSIQVSPTQGKLLQLLAMVRGARRILEIGTLAGYSTIWLARALPLDGRLDTLESEPKHADVARANVDRAGLSDRVEIRVGAAADTLRQLAAAGEEPYDIVFIDADKAGYPDYLSLSRSLTRPGSLIIADNVVRDGAVIDADSQDESVQGVRRFNELLSTEPWITATAVQTVGIKGYDGLAIGLVVPA